MTRQLATMAVVGALIVAACGKSEEEKALQESFVRVAEATSEGVSYLRFRDLVLEARTRYTLAKPQLSAAADAHAQKAADDLSAAATVWQATLDCSGPRYCESELTPPMEQLGLVKDAPSFAAYFGAAYGPEQPDTDWKKPLVSQALTVATLSTTLAEDDLK
jgi:hypothetical protein